jgi:hypothetical protein
VGLKGVKERGLECEEKERGLEEESKRGWQRRCEWTLWGKKEGNGSEERVVRKGVREDSVYASTGFRDWKVRSGEGHVFLMYRALYSKH